MMKKRLIALSLAVVLATGLVTVSVAKALKNQGSKVEVAWPDPIEPTAPKV